MELKNEASLHAYSTAHPLLTGGTRHGLGRPDPGRDPRRQTRMAPNPLAQDLEPHHGTTLMVRRNSTIQNRMRDHVRKVGGNCHICGKPIDYTIPYYLPGTRTPNPEAFVADHDVPLDKGGQHAISNAKPAHWKCNSKKRARIIAPIIRRSGTLK